MDKLKEVLKYVFLISLVWAVITGFIVFSFQKNINIKNLQVQTLGFVIGEISKSPCMEKAREGG